MPKCTLEERLGKAARRLVARWACAACAALILAAPALPQGATGSITGTTSTAFALALTAAITILIGSTYAEGACAVAGSAISPRGFLNGRTRGRCPIDTGVTAPPREPDFLSSTAFTLADIATKAEIIGVRGECRGGTHAECDDDEHDASPEQTCWKDTKEEGPPRRSLIHGRVR